MLIMKQLKISFILIILSIALSLAIYDTYNRYSNLKDTMEIQSSIFQLVELKSANAQWDFELNKIHSDNFPHFDLVNQAAVNYQKGMKSFINASKNIQGTTYNMTTKLASLSSQKKEDMNNYLSEVAVTRNSLIFLDTLLFDLHTQYKNDLTMLKFLAHAQYRLSTFVALNQNIHLKKQTHTDECQNCNLQQNKATHKINQHLGILRSQILLSHKAKEAFYNPEHAKLLTELFEELSLLYVKADTKHQTIQFQVLTFTAILVVTVVTLLVLLYWLYRTIDRHRTAGITDPLTGLYNRKKLFESLQQLIPIHKKSEKKLAFLFIDLDGFKNINDTYGHDIGDKLLQRLSARLKRSVRKKDFIYRIGGDEFVILIQELHKLEDAEFIAEALLKKCNKPYLLEKINCSVTLSIGICLFPDHTQEPSDLLKYADEAMYNSKSKGKSTITTWHKK